MNKFIKIFLSIVVVFSLFLSNHLLFANYEKPSVPSQLSSGLVEKVNLILDTVYSKKDNTAKFPTLDSYVAYLNRISTALNQLKTNFTSTDIRYEIVTYLASWINNIKTSVEVDTSSSNFLDSISWIISEDPSWTATNTWSNTNTWSSTNIWTSTWASCTLKTNGLIWWEKYIDKDNFILVSWREISAKFYLLNWAYKNLTVKCNNWVKSINTSVRVTYACNSGYTISNWICVNNTSNTNTWTSSGTWACTRNWITYIFWDVRCDWNKQVRCDNWIFLQISECKSSDVCYEKPERTSNWNFFTSCKTKTKRIFTDWLNWDVSETEILTLKQNAQYLCSFNASTWKYWNCVFEACLISSHNEWWNCIRNTRACDIVNTSNWWHQTWNATSWWWSCQFIEWYTKCNTWYKVANQVCVTGYQACNSPFIGVNWKSVSIIQSNWVEYSNKTPSGYDWVWSYDDTLSKACTYKCKEWYKKSSEISWYRWYEICILKNICDYDEYYNSGWLNTQHASKACPSCKWTSPYWSSTIYTSSTLRLQSRNSWENDTRKYVNTTAELSESCTWTCKAWFVPWNVDSWPLTCCDPNSASCKIIN